ncbi:MULTISPECIES: hypothetical protein [unclassified Stenotrophomonas]|uniref:hypothetical protein n=1 Tax=unclassified Stenotrophomonas TaxID=196198 RepID=UPI001F3FB443|nr:MULTISPECIES: hypothetical protein [unclassified Stenotrophomonas]
MRLRRCVPPLLLAGVLCTGAYAAPADTLGLAGEVNAQIVHRHMREEALAFAAAFDGSTMMPVDIPAGCKAQMREAVTGMYAATTEHLKAGIEEPEYQRVLEQQLASVYSSDQLQAFLARAADTDTDRAALSAEVLSGPGLKDIEQAQMQKIVDGMDEKSPPSPGFAEALRAASAAKAACERLQTNAG